MNVNFAQPPTTESRVLLVFATVNVESAMKAGQNGLNYPLGGGGGNGPYRTEDKEIHLHQKMMQKDI